MIYASTQSEYLDYEAIDLGDPRVGTEKALKELAAQSFIGADIEIMLMALSVFTPQRTSCHVKPPVFSMPHSCFRQQSTRKCCLILKATFLPTNEMAPAASHYRLTASL